MTYKSRITILIEGTRPSTASFVCIFYIRNRIQNTPNIVPPSYRLLKTRWAAQPFSENLDWIWVDESWDGGDERYEDVLGYLKTAEARATRQGDIAHIRRVGSWHGLVDDQGSTCRAAAPGRLHLPELLQRFHHVHRREDSISYEENHRIEGYKEQWYQAPGENLIAYVWRSSIVSYNLSRLSN